MSIKFISEKTKVSKQKKDELFTQMLLAVIICKHIKTKYILNLIYYS